MRIIAPSRTSRCIRSCCAAAVLATAAGAASAHGFGQRYDLPLPIWLWMTAGAASLALTFVVMAAFVRDGLPAHGPRIVSLKLSAWARPFTRVLQALALALFVLALAAGWLGTQDPYRNLIVTLVWVVWWVGVAFVCALVGDVWALASPINTLHDLLCALLRRVRVRTGKVRYPRWLGAWPAVLLFTAFAWAELLWSGKDMPSALATTVLAYAASSVAAMLLFGRRTWLANGEAFSLAFSLLARFAPVGAGPRRDDAPRVVVLAPFGARLEPEREAAPSFVVFVIVMLSTVTFDGFKETAWMMAAEVWSSQTRWLSRALFTLSEFGIGETAALHTLVMLGFPVAFLGCFLAGSRASLHLALRHGGTRERGIGTWQVAGRFVFALVPIALAYHLSHYLGLLTTAGQLIVPLASDPFGWGWDLFGTAGRRIDIGLVSPAFVWYVSATLIVAGHAIAVAAAHRMALRVFATHAAAVWSQLPMLVLMMAYTTLSLWILAQPIAG